MTSAKKYDGHPWEVHAAFFDPRAVYVWITTNVLSAKELIGMEALVNLMTVKGFLDSLRPGEAMDVLMDVNASIPRDVRRVSLLEVDLKRGILLNQPERPIRRTVDAQRIEISTLRRIERGADPVRLGFYTVVKELIGSYQLVSGTTAAVLVPLPKNIHRANLRFAYRLRIPLSLSPQVRLLTKLKKPLDTEINLIDLSAGGALINYRRPPRTPPLFKLGDELFFDIDLRELVEELQVNLPIGQKDIAHMVLECRIVREYEDTSARLAYGALSFTKLNVQQRDLLHGIILRIQQHLASRSKL